MANPNPKQSLSTRFSKENQPVNHPGRPPGSHRFETLLNKVLDKKITVTEAGQKLEMTNDEVMIMKLMRDAIACEDAADRHRAMAMIMDRVDGKPTMKTEISGGMEISGTIFPVAVLQLPEKTKSDEMA